ncbi:PAS domain-containing sensor histidine kinase [Natronomonas halophila]|uniref:PAS domain-containing sensor histidine kinase n=1 Tax=Natronomonas halophila TaxID=2747817 RepID=UPI0015B5057E|nr:PAS domain-containing sensor histidine kinase [Natronomonas halophila]QLD86161.1 PAS domain-containing sensor histidine kinase [Natronomonas halophila]
MGQDISEEAPLYESCKFLQELVRNISEGLLTIDTGGNILYANPVLEDILGYSANNLIGSPLTKIIPDHLVSAHEAGLARYLDTGEKTLDWTGIELLALHKGGHEVPVKISFRAHDYEGQRLFTGVLTEIADRKEREERLEAQNNKLEEQNQQLEEFAHILSHDLQNPLTIAQGYIDLIQREHEIEELEEVEQAISRIGNIIEDTENAIVNEGANNSLVVRTLQEMAQTAWGSVPTGDAELVVADPVWNIRATEGCFLQLLENVFRNAVEHGGSSVTVEVGVLGDGEGFYVEDDGDGISDEMKVELQSSDESKATHSDGYGLQMVEQVAEEHDWRMEITDAENGGARFELTEVEVFV